MIKRLFLSCELILGAYISVMFVYNMYNECTNVMYSGNFWSRIVIQSLNEKTRRSEELMNWERWWLKWCNNESGDIPSQSHDQNLAPKSQVAVDNVWRERANVTKLVTRAEVQTTHWVRVFCLREREREKERERERSTKSRFHSYHCTMQWVSSAQ